jgi:membrane-associated phospholipid phosphatase
MIAAPAPRPTSALRVPFSPRARAQVGLFLLAYLVYSAARWVTIGDLGVATVNAGWILELERDLGVATEASVQQALNGTWALWVLNHVFLYRRSRPVYERLRNTILATWLISIPVYAAFPVAPPRLADIGLVDTITAQTGFAMDSALTTKFYNELAAVPSLHVGFAVAVGIAVAAAVQHRGAKLLALTWGPLIGLAVVATGNHFVFDIAAGLVASAVGYAAGTAVAARMQAGPRPARALRSRLVEA